MKLRLTRGARWEAKVEKAKAAKATFRNAVVRFSPSTNPTAKTYADLAEILDGMLGSLEGGFAEGPVDMAGLKAWAKKNLPEDSKLRVLIEGEKNDVLFSEWIGKADIYARLYEDEAKELD